MATPLGPAIPQIAKPTMGKTKMSTVQPSLVPELLVLFHTLTNAQISSMRTMTVAAVQKIEVSTVWLPFHWLPTADAEQASQFHVRWLP